MSAPAFWEKFASARGVAVLFLVYGALYSLLRVSSGGALVSDEIHENVLVQSFELGYAFRNPPLYEWLLWSVQQATGPTVASFLIVKYGLLTLAGFFYFLLARRVLGDDRWALGASVSILALYHVGWDLHRMFSHTLALMAAMPVATLALLNVIERRRPADYAALGAAFAIGILAKYLFLVFAASLLVAALTGRAGRAALASPWSLFSAAVMLGVLAPHLLWIAGAAGDFAGASASHLGQEEAYFAGLVRGLGGLIYAPLAFLFPFILIAAACFPKAMDPALRPRESGAILIERAILAAFALLAFGVIFLGVDNVKERFMFAFLYLAPISVFSRVRASAPTRLRLKAYAGALGALTAAALLLRAGNELVGPPFCGTCDHLVPYRPAAEAIAKMGGSGATVSAADFHTAGNLRRFLPEARFTSPHLARHRPYAPPPATDPGCFFVWRLEVLDNARPAEAAALIGAEGMVLEAAVLTAPWEGVMRRRGWRETRWGVMRLAPQAGVCA